MRNHYSLRLARYEELNHFDVHNGYLGQVKNKPRSVLWELSFQFGDVLSLELTTQADCGLSALRSRFDLHGSTTPLHAFAMAESAYVVPILITPNGRGFPAARSTELSGIPDVSVTKHRCG